MPITMRTLVMLLTFIIVAVVFGLIVLGCAVFFLKRRNRDDGAPTEKELEEFFGSNLDYSDMSGTESIEADIPAVTEEEMVSGGDGKWDGINGDYGNEHIGSYDIAMESGSTMSLSEQEYILVDDDSNMDKNVEKDMPLFADDEIIGENRKRRKQPIFYDDEAGTTGLVNPEEEVALPKAFIFRLKTEERTEILKQETSIGKSKSADYTVSGNNTFSRIHCVILFKDGQFYVVDNHSSNKTYVGEELVEPDTLVPINNGDHLLISNEEFVFHTE